MTTEARRSAYLLAASERRDYEWFRLETSGAKRLDHPDDWRKMVPPAWERLEQYVRPGGLTVVLFRTPSDSGVLVMGLPSERRRMGSPLRESLLVTERSTSGGEWVRGLAAAALRSASDQDAGELAPLLSAVRDAPSTDDGLEVDPEAFAAALSALAVATADAREAALPAGAWRDTPSARRRLAATPVWDGEPRTGVDVVAVLVNGVRSERLEGVRWALTSHPGAADAGAADGDMAEAADGDVADASDRAELARRWLMALVATVAGALRMVRDAFTR